MIRDAVRYDYPLREVCLAALPILDELVILCEGTGDGTVEEILRLWREFPQVVRWHVEPWWFPERGRESISDAINRCIEWCRGTYHLQLQADDVFHEEDLWTIQDAAKAGEADYVAFRREHFWGGFDRVHVGGHLPPEALWMARRDRYPLIRSQDDGFGFGTAPHSPNGLKLLHLNEQVPVYHYGFVRKPAALGHKARAMTDLYGMGPDPVMEQAALTNRVEWGAYDNPTVPFTRSHPTVMKAWIEERRPLVEAGWEA